MSNDTIHGKGSCLCGKIRFTAQHMSQKVGACHCSSCRKWGGGPFMEVNCGADVLFEGEEHITVYDSSTWAERGFCSLCGSHLFYRLKKSRQHMMSIGLFEDDQNLVFHRQVFVDEKPSFYSFSNETSEMTGPEIFKKFAAPSE